MNREDPLSLPARRQQVKDRALSRFGLEVGKLMRQALIHRVSNGDVKYARKVNNTRTVIVLEHDGGEMAFIYSNATKEIVSFLGPDAPETADWRCSQSLALALFRAHRSDREGDASARVTWTTGEEYGGRQRLDSKSR
jgi:hypothetical protein